MKLVKFPAKVGLLVAAKFFSAEKLVKCSRFRTAALELVYALQRWSSAMHAVLEGLHFVDQNLVQVALFVAQYANFLEMVEQEEPRSYLSACRINEFPKFS